MGPYPHLLEYVSAAFPTRGDIEAVLWKPGLQVGGEYFLPGVALLLSGTGPGLTFGIGELVVYPV
jgi:hypothetical protein